MATMLKSKFLILFLVYVTAATELHAESAADATYLLQVSSNLSCGTLDIELIATEHNSRRTLSYQNKPFAAVTLPAGRYQFGQVICDGNKAYDVLTSLAPITVLPNQAYFGGRLIFKQAAELDDHEELEVLENCSKVVSRARGDEYGDSATGIACRDGNGVATSLQPEKKINVYSPIVSAEDLQTIRAALNASEQQLRYMPIKIK